MIAFTHHKELNEKCEGKCSAPMWFRGLPAGFCDRPAYSKNVKGYDGYVPYLACQIHGGLSKEESVNLCINCNKCIANCVSNPKFGTGVGNDNVYDCDSFSPKPKN